MALPTLPTPHRRKPSQSTISTSTTTTTATSSRRRSQHPPLGSSKEDIREASRISSTQPPSAIPARHPHHGTTTDATKPAATKQTQPRTSASTTRLDSSRIPSFTSTLSRKPSASSSSPTIATSTQSLHSKAASYSSTHPANSVADAKPTALRRPASLRYSHGIESRALHPAEKTRRSLNPVDLASAQTHLLQSSIASPRDTKPPGRSAGNVSSLPLSRAPTLTRSASEESTIKLSNLKNIGAMASSTDESSEYYDTSERNHAEDAMSGDDARRNGDEHVAEDDESSNHEDVFLNIAQDSPQHNGVPDTVTQRKSRIVRVGQRQSLPVNALQQSPSIRPRSRDRQDDTSSIAEGKQSHYRRASQLPSPSLNTRNLPATSPITPGSSFEFNRARYPATSPKSALSPRYKDSDSSQSYLSARRTSYAETHTPPNRSYRPSNLHYSSSRDHETTPPIDTPSQSHAGESESVESGGAPSTVWDELDDLKQRIRQLETTGKFPSKSGAPSSAERPRTATTTVTTISSSPKHQRKPSDSPTERADSAAPQLHPNLHNALTKAKGVLSPAVYRVLEGAANEALELAAMAGSSGPQGTAYTVASVVNGATVSDRQIRRKADGLCRTITELAIVLCATKNDQQPTSPAVQIMRSRRGSLAATNDDAQSLHTPTFGGFRRGSIDPPESAVGGSNGVVPRSSPSRVMSRIDSRRSSLLNLNGAAPLRDPTVDPAIASTPLQQSLLREREREAAASRISRSGTSLLRARRGTIGEANGTVHDHDDNDRDSTLRAPSRALTEYAALRDRERERKSQRLSRDYAAQHHPLPEVPRDLPLRRESQSQRESFGASLRRPNGYAQSLIARDREEYVPSPKSEAPPPLPPTPQGLSATLLSSRERERERERERDPAGRRYLERERTPGYESEYRSPRLREGGGESRYGGGGSTYASSNVGLQRASTVSGGGVGLGRSSSVKRERERERESLGLRFGRREREATVE